MPSLSIENKRFCFEKVMLHTDGDFYKEKTDDGGSVTTVMGSTSEKKYLCQVPNFGVQVIKTRPSG
jgi:hypothetical protein